MSLPTEAHQPAYVVEEPEDDYRQLLGAARQAALQIIRTSPVGLTDAARYIHQASAELVSKVPETPVATPVGGAIFECLQRLVAVWPDIAARTIEGERVFSADPGLWKRAMSEWPMGGFARMAAEFLIARDLLGGNVLELGAGVGSCSALVAGHVSEGFIRTDLQPFLLKRQKIAGSVERYDFNEPGPWRDLDTIFSVNAVHCARDTLVTLRNLHAMLRPGGILVLGEGRPHTDVQGTPWALNPFFGLFRGWWDIGGFVPRERWLSALEEAGFSRMGFAARRAGAHDLGGIVWGFR